jgi:hypothetical protein
MVGAFCVSLAASLMLILSGAVPIAADFSSCNAEALDAVTTRGAHAPMATSKDRERAAAARRGDPAVSDDPQLTGMELEGARDPGYQAAYRTCMRRRGF